MAGAKDRAVGTVKEIAGELVGDGKLAEEGKRQKRSDREPEQAGDDEPRSGGPLGINELT